MPVDTYGHISFHNRHTAAGAMRDWFAFIRPDLKSRVLMQIRRDSFQIARFSMMHASSRLVGSKIPTVNVNHDVLDELTYCIRTCVSMLAAGDRILCGSDVRCDDRQKLGLVTSFDVIIAHRDEATAISMRMAMDMKDPDPR